VIWAGLILYFGNLSSYGPRYLDVVVIPVMIGAACEFAGLYRKDRAISVIILGYCVLSMFLFMYPMLKYRHTYNGEKQYALFVKEKTEENAVVITMDDAPFIQYYADRKSIGHPVNPKRNLQEIDQFIADVEGYLLRGIPVYLTQSGLSYDPNRLISRAIYQNFNIMPIGEKLSEDYHRPEMKLRPFRQKLFRLFPKAAPP
jgi:hypothetical protein